MSLEQYIFDVAIERRACPLFLRAGLTALSYLFRAGVGLRHFAYARKWCLAKRLPACVISVGNIVVGGTGKTPFVEMLAQALQPMCKTAILSRGFRSEIERSGRVEKIASGGTPFLPPSACGDEPFYLGQETLADVWVGRDRVRCGQRAVQEGAECLILDDGMQHRRLARDIEIVMIDAKDPFSKGRFLPRGRLRELPSRLRHADLIVVNHVESPEHLEVVREQLKHYTEAPLLGVRAKLTCPSPGRVGVYCGIGRPERFVDGLRAVDIDIVDTLFLLDHCTPEEERLRYFIEQCQKKGAERILCTAKDGVKLKEKVSYALPIVAVKMQLEIVAGKEHWDALIKTIVRINHERRD